MNHQTSHPLSTIKFNVGGTRSLSTNIRNEGGGHHIFIVGNGHRFQYVLEFMRYGKITVRVMMHF